MFIGVVLLNACMTVKAHQANSHKDRGWEKFTDSHNFEPLLDIIQWPYLPLSF
jgi:uracil DNA glycosylase